MTRRVQSWLTAVLCLAMLAGQVPSYLSGTGRLASAAGGTISGRVFDGRVAPPLPSMAGVQVRLDLVGGGTSTALTNADGFYEFTGLADGAYLVVFDPGVHSGAALQVWNDKRSTMNGDQIVVANGDAHTGIDATLHATSRLSGTVRQFNQQPASGVAVYAYLAHEFNGAPTCCFFITSTTTAADGTYFMDLDPNLWYKIRFAPNTPNELWYYAVGNSGNDLLSGWTAGHTLGFDGDLIGIDAQFVAQSTITGTATCNGSAMSAVDLRSGTTIVASRNELLNGAFTFTGTAANAKYTLDYIGFIYVGNIAVRVSCSVGVTTDANGNATAGPGSYVPDLGNHTFLTAAPVTSGVGQVDYMAVSGRSNWYKIPIAPGQRLTVTVNGGGTAPLPVDLVLTLFGDIPARMDADRTALANDPDPLAALRQNDAGVAPDGLSPDGLSPDGLSPDGLSPDGLSPDGLSPDGLSPDGLSPDGLSPDGLSPDGLSPDGLSPDGLSPDGLSPDGLSSLYTGAQTESLLRVSDKPGTQTEVVMQNTWTNAGTYYMRVRGHNAAFSASDSYTITAVLAATSCLNVTLTPTFTSTTVLATSPAAGGFKTIILTNTNRLGASTTPLAPAAAAAFRQTLTTFANRPEIGGVVVDFASSGPSGAADSGVAAANAQWDQTADSKTCPAAANIVANTIKKVVNAYGAANPSLHYVVIAGGDAVVPYLRVPDQAGLGNESGYQPPVAINTPSEASLRFGYVQTDGFYGSKTPIARFDHVLYLMDRPTGRLVETPADITAMIAAYSGGYNPVTGEVTKPTSALVTGYDFLADAAQFIAQQWVDGKLTVDQSLISSSWTAADLAAKLLGPAIPAYGVVALNGHFSANTMLAADFATRLKTIDFAAIADTRFRNMLILSSGCHSGYNIVDDQGVLNVTQPLDWPQLFNGKGATLIGGTGYQYGDTDFRKYTELILSNVSQELRYGTGPVAVGDALANAKRTYLSQVATLSGTDEKALVESTLYGLPMFTVNLPAGGRLTRPGSVPGAVPVAGTSSGLSVASLAPGYTLTRRDRNLSTVTGTQVASYYDATYGSTVNDTQVTPGSQILPRVIQDVHYDTTRVARGVVLDHATFTNHSSFFMLTGSAAIEGGGSRAYFTSPVATPVVPFALNTFVGENLILTPAQFRSMPAGSPTGVERTLDTQTLRVYYSSRTDAPAALAAAPIIYNVLLSPDANPGLVDVDVTIGGSIAPGVETVLATYTQNADAPAGSWTSVDLGAGFDTSTDAYHFIRHYTGTVPVGPDGIDAVRVFIQAVGGNALVSRATNNGEYYAVPRPSTATVSAPLQTSALALTAPATTATQSSMSVSATLAGPGGLGIANAPVTFTFNGPAPTSSTVLTNGSGLAASHLRADAAPGAYSVTATFAGDGTFLGSTANAPISVTKAASAFTAAAPAAITYTESGVIATLSGGGHPLVLAPVTIALGAQTVLTSTDGSGRVRLNTMDLAAAPSGTYTVGYAGDGSYAAAAPLTRTISLTPAAATVAGGTSAPQATGPINVTATVVEVPDSTPGNITKAQVKYELVNSNTNTSAGTATATVAADGSSHATIANVPSGLYHLNTTVVGGYYTSPMTSTILVVYDTTTSATGLGWVITTAAGSPGFPTGRKAVFGFVAKYLKGQSTPSGAVELNVERANFNFLALPQFDWLIVSSGGRAEIQGTGYVNKTGGYKFRLIATDARPDTFELRIWNTTTNPSSSFNAPLYKVSGNLASGNVVIR